MKLKKYFLIAGMVVFTIHAKGNGLQITNVTINDEYTQISFDIAWENSWRQTERFHDAVWLFVKYRPDNSTRFMHGHITGGTAGNGLELITQPDSMGVFIRNDSDFIGDISSTAITFDLALDPDIAIHPDFKVYGLEMVYVPKDNFYVGDGSPSSLKALNYYYEGSLYPKAGDPYITSVFDSSFASFTKDNGESIILPPAYPNGYDAFYCMKYPLTIGQFSDFLTMFQYDAYAIDYSNKIDKHIDRALNRQAIYRDDSDPDNIVFGPDGNGNQVINEPDDGASVVAFIPHPDFMPIYLDWSGLRPMSELEFEKACRGPLQPVKDEYAWGTNIADKIDALENIGLETETFRSHGAERRIITGEPARVGIMAGAGFSRLQSAASYWGIMDLSNYQPLLVSVESVDFNSENGDGNLITKPMDWWHFPDIPYVTRMSGEVSANSPFGINEQDGGSFIDSNQPIGLTAFFTFWGVRTP